MSGGAYDHVHGRVDEFANLLTRGVTWEGNRVHNPHPLRLEFAVHLGLVAAAMEAIELVDSYDSSTPFDVMEIEKVLRKPVQVNESACKPVKPSKQVTWNRDETEMDALEPLETVDGDRNALLEHALLTMAVGHTRSPSGKRRLTRTELQELARGLCNKLGIDWSGLSRVGVDLSAHDVDTMSTGHKIKLPRGFKLDKKTGKVVRKPSFASVSDQLQRGSAKKQRVVRRTP